MVEEYRKAFTFFDANNDGYITMMELESAMNKCSVFPSKLELRSIMSQADKDSWFFITSRKGASFALGDQENGVITFDEFVYLMRYQESHGLYGCVERPDEKQLWIQFRMFDKDNDGFICREEMAQLVKDLSLGAHFPVHVVDQLFHEADIDGDGKISFDGDFYMTFYNKQTSF